MRPDEAKNPPNFPRILEKPNPAGKQKPRLRRVRKLPRKPPTIDRPSAFPIGPWSGGEIANMVIPMTPAQMAVDCSVPCMFVVIAGALIVILSMLIRARRRAPHGGSRFCPVCGYDVSFSKRCPECGEVNANWDGDFWGQR